jgi:Ca-activated chloride channel family protein
VWRVAANGAKFEDVVVALDSSISMRAKDYEPSRFEVAKAALKRFLEVRLSTCPMDRVGVVVFYGFALPVSEPSAELNKLLDLVSRLKVLGEATNLGDAIIAGAKMFEESTKGIQGFSRRLLVITDGTFNQGPDPWAASVYAVSKGVRIDFVTLGKIEQGDLDVIQKCVSETGGVHLGTQDAQQLFAHVVGVADRRSVTAKT